MDTILQQKSRETENVLKRVYSVLKITSKESEKVMYGLSGLQLLLVIRVILESVSKEEAEELKKVQDGPEDQKQRLMEELVSRRKNDKEFAAKVRDVLEKAFKEHVTSLKQCGNDDQKREVAKILAEIGY